jgi:hypothetical protein
VIRRTLLLTVAVPTVLLIAGTASGTGTAVVAPDGAATSTPPVTASVTDTSDGAVPADALLTPPGTGPGVDLGPTMGPPMGSPDAPERSPEGFLIAPGGDVMGSGPRWRYTVEVEPATGLDLHTVASEVAQALSDPRSWARTRTLEQVDDPGSARIRLLVATPDTVDRLCAQVGLRTNGIFSCWNGRFAAMNSWRWEVGATGFDDLGTYRTYLINHEFGHGLGYGHVGCPTPGAPAPVMMQQSKGLDGCRPNGWPYP